MKLLRDVKPASNDGFAMICMAVLFAVVLLRTAWVCDDAYISFRAIDNFIHGYGLTWNIAERVQTFTNPLWTLCLSVFYFFTREIYLTSIFLSILISLAAFWILTCRIAAGPWMGLIGALFLIFSCSFVDYSTSGLENALTHLLLALLFWVYFSDWPDEKKAPWLALIASLGLTNRMDQALLFLPPLAHSLWAVRHSRKSLSRAALAFAPFVLWECFALFYYGFPFPNTAYAKTNLAIPRIELIHQGAFYFLDTINHDPLLAVTVILALGSALLINPGLKHRIAAAGMAAQLGYVLWVGGDFMSGRFLTSVYFTAVILITSAVYKNSLFSPSVILLFLVPALGFAAPVPTLLSHSTYAEKKSTQASQDVVRTTGIANERAYYFSRNGLLNQSLGQPMPNNPVLTAEKKTSSNAKRRVAVYGGVGMVGFGAGPSLHIVDEYALGDPLLARIPFEPQRIWRIGHFSRPLPYGYLESLEKEGNLIQEKNLKQYYDHLNQIIRGRLFSGRRVLTILKMNFGFYRPLMQAYTRSFNRTDLKNLQSEKKAGTPWNAPGNIILPRAGIWVDLPKVQHQTKMQISVDHNDEYLIVYYQKGKNIAEQTLPPQSESAGGLAVRQVNIPAQAWEKGYDAIRLMPISRDEKSSLGHLKLLES